jgi:hypothetical protein
MRARTLLIVALAGIVGLVARRGWTSDTARPHTHASTPRGTGELAAHLAPTVRHDPIRAVAMPESTEPAAEDSRDAEPEVTGISGGVYESPSGEPVVGVTVIASSPSMERSQFAITDENGDYTISLPPGDDYLVTFYYAAITIERPSISVFEGETTPVFQGLDSTEPGRTIITIDGEQLRIMALREV